MARIETTVPDPDDTIRYIRTMLKRTEIEIPVCISNIDIQTHAEPEGEFARRCYDVIIRCLTTHEPIVREEPAKTAKHVVRAILIPASRWHQLLDCLMPKRWRLLRRLIRYKSVPVENHLTIKRQIIITKVCPHLHVDTKMDHIEFLMLASEKD